MEEIIWLEIIKLKGILLINNFRKFERKKGKKKGKNKKKPQKNEEISLIVCHGENLTNQGYSRKIFQIDQGSGNINKKVPLSRMKNQQLSFTIYPSLLNTLETSEHDLIEKASENEGNVRICFNWLQGTILAKDTTNKSTKKSTRIKKRKMEKRKRRKKEKKRDGIVLELEVGIEVEKSEEFNINGKFNSNIFV